MQFLIDCGKAILRVKEGVTDELRSGMFFGEVAAVNLLRDKIPSVSGAGG